MVESTGGQYICTISSDDVPDEVLGQEWFKAGVVRTVLDAEVGDLLGREFQTTHRRVHEERGRISCYLSTSRMMVTVDDGDEDRFQLAAGATRRIVAQCRSHVRKVTVGLSRRLERASASSPYAADVADEGHHLALSQRIGQIEASNNALLSHFNGLVVLLENDTFYPLPAIPIVRSVAEVAAAASWTLDVAVDRDTRNARTYATLFRSIDGQVARMRGDSAQRGRELRERLASELSKKGVRIERRERSGQLTEEVSQVLIRRGHAKTAFRYSQRIASEVPGVAGLYAGMSGAVHGEQTHVATTWDSPGTSARLIGVVARRSVEAWSDAVHAWVGAERSNFVNEQDWRNLIRSVPSALIAEFTSV